MSKFIILKFRSKHVFDSVDSHRGGSLERTMKRIVCDDFRRPEIRPGRFHPVYLRRRLPGDSCVFSARRFFKRSREESVCRSTGAPQKLSGYRPDLELRETARDPRVCSRKRDARPAPTPYIRHRGQSRSCEFCSRRAIDT